MDTPQKHNLFARGNDMHLVQKYLLQKTCDIQGVKYNTHFPHNQTITFYAEFVTHGVKIEENYT